VLIVGKYPLLTEPEQVLELPATTRIISVAEQRNEIVLYAIVDLSEAEQSKHKVWVIGTGHPLPEQAALGRFLGTVNLYSGSLMFHVFTKEIRIKAEGSDCT
jgi:hypothetical protein